MGVLPPASLPPERQRWGEYGDGGAGRGARSHQRCSRSRPLFILLAPVPPFPNSAPPRGETPSPYLRAARIHMKNNATASPAAKPAATRRPGSGL